MDPHEEITDETLPTGCALSPKQELALQALLTYPTLKEAAEAAGISEPTLWRYRKDRTFAERLREARHSAVEHAGLRSHQASLEALTILCDVMKSERAKNSDRISAARAVLSASRQAYRDEEICDRIDQLEEYLLAKQREQIIEDAIDNPLGYADEADEVEI